MVSRRAFLAGAAALASSSVCASDVARPAAASGAVAGLGAPALFNPSETGVDVLFEVPGLSAAFVEWAEGDGLSGAVRTYAVRTGIRRLHARYGLVRLSGLKPATRYTYRVGCDRVAYRSGYDMRRGGTVFGARSYSFWTLGAAREGRLCVINDTHGQEWALRRVLGRLSELRPDFVLWNGDASTCSETEEAAIGVFLRAHAEFPEWASASPVLFVRGNHDCRGLFNRHLEDLVPFRPEAERPSGFADLGRNFAVRMGSVALIGLDTGEDKLDANPAFAGLFEMAPYRARQAQWLAAVAGQPSVRDARHKMAFCHIPLYDDRPEMNPGDAAPADAAPQYAHDWCKWQRPAAQQWGGLLNALGVAVVVSGHQHHFHYYPPHFGPLRGCPERDWAQLCGGGHHAEDLRHPTVIDVRTEGGRLRVACYDVFRNKIDGVYCYG